MVSIQGPASWTWKESSRYGRVMDWLWPLYERYVRRLLGDFDGISEDQAALQDCFLSTLSVSTATIYVMEPTAKGAIIFKGLGHWPLPDEPGLLSDPNDFLAARYGGGKFKVNFIMARTSSPRTTFAPGERRAGERCKR